MESITIRISEYSEGGYYYDIWPSDVVETDTESDDGGLCTTTMLNALEMAHDQAGHLIIANGVDVTKSTFVSDTMSPEALAEAARQYGACV